MKTILITMTALAGVAATAPAAGQPWDNHGSRTGELRMQLDAGIGSGEITRREAIPLRSSLRQLINLERQFSANGFSGRENAMLRQRSAQLASQIRRAERTGAARSWAGDGDDRGTDRYDRDDRYARDDDRRDGWDRSDDRDNDRWGSRRDGRDNMTADSRFDRPNSGDRFAGDARVGHAATLRMRALPEALRNQFPDTDQIYYRYDGGRIFRIDRRTNMVLGLLDL